LREISVKTFVYRAAPRATVLYCLQHQSYAAGEPAAHSKPSKPKQQAKAANQYINPKAYKGGIAP